MQDELDQLFDAAIYKEVASQAFYSAGQRQTPDRGAQALMAELAAEEQKHAERLKGLRGRKVPRNDRRREQIADLRISSYLSGGDSLAGAGLQDTLTFAIKREQESVEFYSNMASIFSEPPAKRLCERMVHEELKHKLRLETLYDELFYQED